jgi:hypothetical protein
MSAPPEANTEYSRGSEPFGRLLVRGQRRESARPADVREGPGKTAQAVVIAVLLGALLIVVAQFTELYQLHSATASAPIKTVGTGANHAWAPIPIALLAVVLAFALYRSGNRAALIAIAVLGIVTLLIALLGDLPNAHASGLVGSGASQYAEATSTPSAGLYMETLGAVVLLLAGGVGFLLLSPREPAGAGAAAARET